MLLVIALLLALSCSRKYLFTPQSTTGRAALQEHLGAVCLSGEGRGRLSWLGKRASFSYESLFVEPSWKLALSFPFRAPLVLDIKRGEGLNPKVLREWEARGGREVRLISLQLGRLLDVLAGGSYGEEQWALSSSNEGFSLTMGEEGGGRSFELRASHFNGQYFKKIVLRIPKEPLRKQFGLEFFVENCEKN